jgi:hypothetical protein
MRLRLILIVAGLDSSLISLKNFRFSLFFRVGISNAPLSLIGEKYEIIWRNF